MLNINSLQVRYGTSDPVLRGVDIKVPTGSLVCVLGTNGVGKSTLLRTLAGSLSHYGGEIVGGSIEWNGADLTKSGADKRVRAGMVLSPEGRGIFPNLTVDDNLRAGGFTRRRKEVEPSMNEMYDLFPELVAHRTKRGGLLSGGQQQMLAIARALMARPQLLLLDEPSLGLAPKAVDNIARVIRGINERGTGVVLVEQNAVVALDLAEHAYVLEGGRVALEGPAEDLKHSDEVRRLYLGIDVGHSPSGGTSDAGGMVGHG